MAKNLDKTVEDLTKLAIVIPVYNEQEVLPDLFKRLNRLGKKLRLKHVDIYLVFVNDGSSDESQKILEDFVNKKSRIFTGKVAIKFTKNFGHQAALKAGYDWVIENTNANYILTIDADLQDPPELIEQMLDEALQKNYDIVYAKRKVRKEGKAKVLTADVFYWFLEFITSTKVEREVADFRLVKRRILEVALEHAQKPLFWRGLFATLTNNVGFVTYNRKSREKGSTGYSILKMLKLAIAGVTTMGDRIPVYVGYGAIGLLILGVVKFLANAYAVPFLFSRLYIDSWFTSYSMLFMGLIGTLVVWYAYGLINKGSVIYVIDKVVSKRKRNK